jgi:hypothetical protein
MQLIPADMPYEYIAYEQWQKYCRFKKKKLKVKKNFKEKLNYE